MTDALGETIVRRAEAASSAMLRRFMVTAAHAEVSTPAAHLDVAGGIAAFFGVGSPNSIVRNAATGAAWADSEFERALAFYRERGDHLRVDVTPATHGSLREWLLRNDAKEVLYSHAYMRRLDSRVLDAVADGVEIRDVDTSNSAEFEEIVSRGFNEGGLPPDHLVHVFDDMRRVQNRIAEIGRYLGVLDGVAVGGGRVMWIEVPEAAGGGRIAMLQGGATMPAARRRGVQSALIRVRLARAFREGCDTAVIVCEPDSASQRNIVRAGFEYAYDIRRWAVGA